jgi:hypothetical protein
LEVFNQANYNVIKEVPIPDLPNTFLWILSPKKRTKNGPNSIRRND